MFENLVVEIQKTTSSLWEDETLSVLGNDLEVELFEDQECIPFGS